MRKIGQLNTQQEAERFHRYLLSLELDGQVDARDDQWEVWIHAEDDVDRARTELTEFQQTPHDSKYDVRVVPRPKPQEPGSTRPPAPSSPGMPVTIVLFAVSMFVTLWTDFGQKNLAVVNALLFTPSPSRDFSHLLAQWTHGEVWRLYTPMFLHLSILHLVFNMYMTWVLGGVIEHVKGSWYVVMLVAIIAPVSHLMEFAFVGGNFGGMSGVLYGFFGYLWMRARLLPFDGFVMPPGIVIQLMIWLVLGFSGVLGAIANYAHLGGLLAGMVLGAYPKFLPASR